MRLFAKRELKVATTVEAQTLNGMERELNVNDIKWFRTVTRRYLQMLRHETESDEDSEVKKGAWSLARQHLGDFATKDLDTAPSSGGWLSMVWGGSGAKKEDPRWEETAGEVGYVMGWSNPEEDASPESSEMERLSSESAERPPEYPQNSPDQGSPLETLSPNPLNHIPQSQESP